jgi:hypothetical protein
MAQQVCIYCTRTDNETAFSREHIIPQNIGGSLFFDDYVCTDCNSSLGANVDVEILKVPEVIDAFESLRIPYDKFGIVKRYYNVIGSFDGLELRGRLTRKGFEFPPQTMPDGSMVAPEQGFAEPLTKSLSRDQKLVRSGIPPEEIKAEIQMLLEAYRNAKPGERVHSPPLRRALVKRSSELKVKLTTRDKPRVNPLIAKIAYEFLFLLGGRHLFEDENAETCDLLRDAIAGKRVQRLSVQRLQPDNTGYQPHHIVHLKNESSFLCIRILFFGSIYFVLISPRVSPVLFAELSDKMNTMVAGLGFQQCLDRNAKAFWAVMEDGIVKRLV